MNVSKITIGRLYNLGNYEHVRYELTVDVAPKESAKKALLNTLAILAAINPKPRGVPTVDEVERDQVTFDRANSSKLSAADFRCQFGEPVGGRTEYVKRLQADLLKKKRILKKWTAYREKALEAFDNLGGSTIYKDAKDNWSEYDDNY